MALGFANQIFEVVKVEMMVNEPTKDMEQN